jgi:hypothetical protein
MRTGAGERLPERTMLFNTLTLLRRRKIRQFKLPEMPEPPVLKLSAFELTAIFMYRT